MNCGSWFSHLMLSTGEHHPERQCFIIAEVGVNHNGSLDLATRLVDVAAEAGATAVKFQSFKAEKLVLPSARKARYQAERTGSKESQFEMLKRLELSESDHRDLFNYCKKRGIIFLSTPFDEESADFLESLGITAYKLPSGEITNFRLLRSVARKQKPIILSTGMCTLSDVESALSIIESQGNTQVALLHTVSSYPADPQDVNLKAIDTLAAAFGKPVGYSDHTLGIEVALAAVARGACIVEKHLTLDRRFPGPDHAASAEPAEFAQLVKGIRNIEKALGDGRKKPRPSENDISLAARRSIVLAKDVAAGTCLTEEHLALRRPGNGLPPSLWPLIIGRTMRHDASEGTPLTLEMLQ